MKNKYLIVAVIILILILGYLGRHKIKTLLMGSSTPAPTTQISATPTTAAPTNPASTSATVSNGIVMTKSSADKGNFLTDTKGMTLYTFDKDTKNQSNCTGGCVTKWPPFVAPAVVPANLPADILEIKRDNGLMQYTYKGMPLYYFATDKKPGDTLGDGVGGIWHIVKP